MIKQILVMPIVHYLVIAILFILYIFLEWKKRSSKQNGVFVLLCLVSLFNIRFGYDMETMYLLDSFHSDTVVIKSADKTTSVEIDKLFSGDYGVFSEHQSVIDIVKRFSQKADIELYFYQNNK